MRPNLIKYNYIPKKLLGRNLTIYINITCLILIIILVIYLTYRYYKKDDYKKHRIKTKQNNMKKLLELIKM